jgi:quercetin dioxygenase-like cupin family protein
MKTALVTAAALAAATLCPLHATAQMPATQVILENASVRVALLTFVPGGATGRHQSIESEIGIVLEGELTVESPTGRQRLGPGEVYWMPGLTPHDVRNEGGRPAKLWDIFLKRCD